MSAILIECAQVLPLGEVKKDQTPTQEGKLQGRKVLPFAFYLQVVGSLTGGLASVALIIAAIAFSQLLLFAAAFAALLCITNAVGAYYIRKFSPNKDLNIIIEKISTCTKEPFLESIEENKIINVPTIEVKMNKKKEEIDIETFEEEDIFETLDVLQENINNQVISEYRNSIVDYSRKYRMDMITLQTHLNNIINLLVERGEEISNVEQLKREIPILNIEEHLDEPNELFEKLNENIRDLNQKFQTIIPLIKRYIEEYDQDYQQLRDESDNLSSEVDSIRRMKSDLEETLRAKELENENLRNEITGFNNQLGGSFLDINKGFNL